jgi:hypothetical protein
MTAEDKIVIDRLMKSIQGLATQLKTLTARVAALEAK